MLGERRIYRRMGCPFATIGEQANRLMPLSAFPFAGDKEQTEQGRLHLASEKANTREEEEEETSLGGGGEEGGGDVLLVLATAAASRWKRPNKINRINLISTAIPQASGTKDRCPGAGNELEITRSSCHFFTKLTFQESASANVKNSTRKITKISSNLDKTAWRCAAQGSSDQGDQGFYQRRSPSANRTFEVMRYCSQRLLNRHNMTAVFASARYMELASL
ncbi:hypothetical protein WN51_04837 [Melipona quadrifasciata]|uniref:Uncharacterized protein n=1 Tax=Melipona quadrifasciata TaxID=166423 RepID=A0A0N0BDH3_9HYME|nr:hypothetical protein WN51_04837 [Melipona quadrifasciata]